MCRRERKGRANVELVGVQKLFTKADLTNMKQET